MPKDRVVLKPFLSLKPRVYVPILWAIIAIAIIFLLFFLHGIRNRGSILAVSTVPPRASVFVDGKFFGTDADATFLPRGSYAIEIRKTGYLPHKTSLTSSQRIFGTLFFPSRKRLNVTLAIENEQAIIDSLVNRLALSSNIGHNAVFSGEASLTLALEEALATNHHDLVLDLFVSALPFLSGAHNHDDARKAITLLKHDNQALLDRIVQAITTRYPNVSLADSLLPPALLEELSDFPADEFPVIETTQSFRNTIAQGRSESGSRIFVAGIPFRFVRGGTSYVMQNTGLVYPHRFELPDFYIMERELSVGQFREFIESDYYAALPAQYSGTLYDEDALAGLSENEALRFVSLSGARSFAAYIADRIAQTPLGQNSTIRLPYSQEWEYAALLDDSYAYASWGDDPKESTPSQQQGRIGLHAMFGGVWEWIENPYTPLHGYIDESLVEAAVLQEVRGASWIQQKQDLYPNVRGVQDPQWTTPYLGFRLVMIPATR